MASLPAGDRVRLIAVDLNAIPLTKGFVAPDGKEITKQSRRSMPACRRDRPTCKGSNAALESYPAESKRSAGSGLFRRRPSRAHLSARTSFKQLVGRLVAARLPVDSYLIGNRGDFQLLGCWRSKRRAQWS